MLRGCDMLGLESFVCDKKFRFFKRFYLIAFQETLPMYIRALVAVDAQITLLVFFGSLKLTKL